MDEAQPQRVNRGLIIGLDLHDHNDRSAFLDSLRRTGARQDLADTILRALALQRRLC